MKIHGQPLTEKNHIVANLRRGESTYQLILGALPMGWIEKCRVRGLLDYPEPPKKILRDGKQILRDPSTNKAAVEEDRDDPAYLEKLREINKRINAITLAEHLKSDPSVEFEASVPETDDPALWRAYGDQLAAELMDPETGFTDDEVDALLNRAATLACRVKFEEATKDFLQTRLSS